MAAAAEGGAARRRIGAARLAPSSGWARAWNPNPAVHRQPQTPIAEHVTRTRPNRSNVRGGRLRDGGRGAMAFGYDTPKEAQEARDEAKALYTEQRTEVREVPAGHPS